MGMMEQIENILNVVVANNTIGAYLLSAFVFWGLVLLLKIVKKILVQRLSQLAAKTTNDFDDFIVGLIAQVGLPVFVVVSLYVATSSLVLSESLRSFIRYALVIVVTIRIMFILQEVIRYSVGKVYHRRMPAGDQSAEAMVRSVTGILRWVIWIMGGIFVLDNLGINISALVAGIGIGGIAIAMASQAVLGDAFSALSIFLDKPFAIGDFIIIDEHMGVVEHIGIKTTRIRSLSGEQLVFSNSDLTKSRIRNYKRMDTRRIAFKIGVVYQTPLEQVKKIPLIIKDIFNRMDNVRLDRVHFQSFGDFALIYEIVYYVLSSDYNIYMDKQQEINFMIMDVFETEAIELAYPTQTLYIEKDS